MADDPSPTSPVNLLVEFLPPGSAEAIFLPLSPELRLPPHANPATTSVHVADIAPASPAQPHADPGATSGGGGEAHAAADEAPAPAPSGPTTRLPLFHSCNLLRPPHAPPHAQPSASSSPAPPSFNADVLMHAGGLVWALEFCPMHGSAPASSAGPSTASVAGGDAPATAQHCELLAAAVHPAGVTRNKAGQVLSGTGGVQIWAVPNSTQSIWADSGGSASGNGSGAGGDSSATHGADERDVRQGSPLAVAAPGEPRVAMVIVHEGRVAWDVKWCPQPWRVRTTPMALSQQAVAGQGQPAAGPRAAEQQGSGQQPDLQQPPPAKRPARGQGQRGKGQRQEQQQQDAVASGPAPLRSVGLLAMALGSGDVHFVSVPDPSDLPAVARSEPGSGSGSGAAAAEGPARGGRKRGAAASVAAAADPNATAAGDGAAAAAAAAAQPSGDAAASGGTSVASPVHAVRLPLQYVITREMMSGSLACALEWQRQPSSSSADGDGGGGGGLHGETAADGAAGGGLLLLVGCVDGMVAGWRLPAPAIAAGPSSSHLHQHQHQQQQLTCLFQIQADDSPIWSINWCPPSEAYNSADALQRHTFMTAAHSGHVKIWDVRDLSLPLQKHLLSRVPSHAAAWTVAPRSVLTLHEDGTLRQLIMEPLFFSTGKETPLGAAMAGRDQGCLWSVGYSLPLSCILYCGDDGIAAIMQVEMQNDPRKRLPHAPIGGLVRNKGVLWVLSHSEVAGAPSLYPGGPNFTAGEKPILPPGRKSKESKPAPSVSTFKDEMQTLYACTISPNVTSQGRAWVAYGGRAGLIRCQRISIGEA